MSFINGNDQPWHPVEHLAFWKSLTHTPNTVRSMAKIYDELAPTPEQKKLLDELLSWACQEASANEAYDQGDC